MRVGDLIETLCLAYLDLPADARSALVTWTVEDARRRGLWRTC